MRWSTPSSRLIEKTGANQVDLNTARRLRDFQRRLPPSSDRMFELRKILATLGVG
jgi:hypothetical protein